MSSPPLDLPGELKNLIYNLEVPETTMHVPSSGAITVFFSDAEQAYTSSAKAAGAVKAARPAPLALQHVCKTIRRETMVHFYTRTTLVLSSPLAARMFFPRVPPALLARIPPIQLIIKPEGYQPRSRREVRTQAAHRNLTIEQGRTACCKGNCLKDPIQMRVLGMPLDATRTEVLSHQPLGSIPFKLLSRLTSLNVDIHHNIAREHLNAKIYPNYLDIMFATGVAIGCQYFSQQTKASTTFRIFSRNAQLMGEMVSGEIRGDSFNVMLASQRCRTMCYGSSGAVWDKNLCACIMQVEKTEDDWVPYEVDYVY
ncbi:hypothetical protein H2199_000807 [Coniosporium tulheliwenetii]|uniref:Uncharacterized protein n=1 Tax=Coniosporium tulheliwenetii TaxID=3383036 RepID=A0ACC2ZMV4_9PEZI|nr:hypothetical protein H2199_000807 [Cladosporium sp. JES 115]